MSEHKLARKMVGVMRAMQRIPKSGFNEHFKYAYATSEDVNDAVRSAMAGAGIAFYVDMVSVVQEGKKTVVKFEFTFSDTETGEQKVCLWQGEALDTQDKGISKATTSAVKYFLLKTFLISTGDEPDPDASKGVKPDPKKIVEELGYEQFEEESKKKKDTKPDLVIKRPYTPEQLRERLAGIAAKHDNFKPTDNQVGLLRYALTELFAGDDNHEDKRHAVLAYLSGSGSTKDTSGALWKAIVEQWTNFTKRDDGSNEYFVNDTFAAQEAAAIVDL